LVSATEEVEAELPPAMNAAIKIFKHINRIEEINSDGTLSASAPDICSVRLLVPAAQAVHLIGTQGVTIKSIQESIGAMIRIIDEGMLLSIFIKVVQLKAVCISGRLNGDMCNPISIDLLFSFCHLHYWNIATECDLQPNVFPLIIFFLKFTCFTICLFSF
jgi:hypothetical protein